MWFPGMVRSGVHRLFLGMGIALVVVGVGMGVVGVCLWIATDDTGILGLAILFPIGVIAGSLMHLAGRRARVEWTADHLMWTPVIGRSHRVPWAAIYRVEVPVNPLDSLCVRLWLYDGTIRRVTPLRMSSQSDAGAWADGGYRRAGRQVTEAHQAWIASQRPRP